MEIILIWIIVHVTSNWNNICLVWILPNVEKLRRWFQCCILSQVRNVIFDLHCCKLQFFVSWFYKRLYSFQHANTEVGFNMTTAKITNDVDPLRDERTGKVREVGAQAVWSLSSCKPGTWKTTYVLNLHFVWVPVTNAEVLWYITTSGFGVEQLRDDTMETYWQSDGQLPHLVNIQFRRKTTVQDICIYTDYKLDESYTPSR